MAAFGLSVALLTPFHRDGSLDVGRLSAHAAQLLTRGVETITLFGTTGEGASIGAAERVAAIDGLRERGIGGSQTILATFETAIPDVLDLMRQGGEAGVRDFLLTPPFFFKGPDDEGLFAWHAQVLERCDPDACIILYNIPQVTSVPLSPDLTARLVRAFPGRIRAMKDSSGSWDSAQAYLAIPDLTVLVGDERLLHRAMQNGAGGAISGMANIHPERMRRIVDTGHEDRAHSAETDAVVARPVIPALKALLSRQSGVPDWTNIRPPLVALDDASRDALFASATLDRAI